MSTYETHIGNVDNSVFAVGENAKAEGKLSAMIVTIWWRP